MNRIAEFADLFMACFVYSQVMKKDAGKITHIFKNGKISAPLPGAAFTTKVTLRHLRT